MSERRRLVHGKQCDYFVCDVHGWEFDERDIDDVCPVCRGEQMERERIIALFEDEFYEDDVNMDTMLVNYGLVIALIKGEEQ